MSDDQRAYDLLKAKLHENPNYEDAPEIAAALGLDNDDFRAVKIVAQHPGDMRVFDIDTKIAAKIANSKPMVPEQGITDQERADVKDYLANEPEVAAKYLKRRGYETKLDGSDIFVRRPNQTNWRPIDLPVMQTDMAEAWKDLKDIRGDVTQMAAENAAEMAYLPARNVTGPATTLAFETARQNVAKAKGLRDDVNESEIAMQTGISAATPALLRTGKLVAGGLSDLIGAGAKKMGWGAKQNAKEIMEASKQLGMKVTPAQVLEGKTVSNAQDSLVTRTGTLPGTMLRADIEESNKVAKDVAMDIVADRSGTKADEAGMKAARELAEGLEKKLQPAEEIYEKYETKFKFVTVAAKKYQEKIASYAKDFRHDKGVQAVLGEVNEMIPKMRDVSELKNIRSTVGNLMRQFDKGTDERYVLGQIYRDLTEIRTESLLKRAKGEGESFYRTAEQEIRQADATYKDAIGSVENILGRGKKIQGSPKAAMGNFLEKTREFDLTTKIFDVKDPKRLAKVKADYPEVFETLRKQKLEDIAERSTVNGEINFKRLAKNISQLPDASAEYLVGKDRSIKIKALKAVADSIPEPANPSGTAGKLIREAANFANPAAYVMAVGALTKSAWLDIISNPVTGRGILNKIAKEIESQPVRTAVRQGQRELWQELNEPEGLTPPQQKGLTIPGR